MNFSIENEFLWIQSHLSKEIDFLADKIILITGVSGFFGWWILNFFLFVNLSRGNKSKIKIIGLTRDVESLKKKIIFPTNELSLYHVDLNKPFKIKEDYDYVIHMATTSAHETFNGEPDIAKINLLENGTKHLLAQISKKVKKILFTSSGVVYAQSNKLVNEESPLFISDSPNTGLAYGKVKAENILTEYSRENNIDFVIARCFSFVGPNLPMNIHYAIGNFIENALNKNDIVINGDGLPRRSYLYITDTVVWLIKLLIFRKGIYNVGSSDSISIYDLAKKIKTITSSNTNIVVKGDSNDSVGNLKRNVYVPNVSKIKKDLKVNVYHSLDDSILRTINLRSMFK